jgi:hypothetical protein
MTAIIPFDSGSKLPAYLSNRTGSINKDVLATMGAKYPVLSIKGKVFTLVKGSEKKLLTREIDGEEEAVQSLQLVVVRANTKYRVFYATQFTEGESDNKKPTCVSNDGVAPNKMAAQPQNKTCQGCPQNVWGVRDGKGTACSVKTRLAVIDPANMNLEEPYLLNVPAASRAGFAQLVEQIDARGADYNAAVIRVSFDKEAAAPKLVFKPTGWLSQDVHEKVAASFDADLVKEMVGVVSTADTVDHDEGTGVAQAAQAARTAVAAAKAKPAPVVDLDDIEDVVAKAEKPVEGKKAKPAKKEATAASTEDLLADMDALLGNKDD